MEELTWEFGPIETLQYIEGRNWSEQSVSSVIVWVHADWCKPCCRIQGEIEEMAKNSSEQQYWFDLKVPQDEIEKLELKEVWGFQTIPCFFMFNPVRKEWTHASDIEVFKELHIQLK